MDSNVVCDSPPRHVVLFPFMSKGHIVPLLHFASLLLRRCFAVTIFTTPANRPFISQFLGETTAAIIDLSFPTNIPGIPPGVENTEKLPSISLFYLLAKATELMKPDFERALQDIPPISFIVSDGFLWWTLDSASKFGLKRFSFYGMSYYVHAVTQTVARDRLLSGLESDDQLFTVTKFPWVKLTRSDFDPIFRDPESEISHFKFTMASIESTINSHGLIMNSFHELEPVFAESFHREGKPRAWSTGPFCLAAEPRPLHEKPYWVRWLDQKLSQENPVLYVAFGSQSEISSSQLKEIATGLEESRVNFMWVTRKNELDEMGNGFEERVRERGIVVREWVDQRENLMHESVIGFLSHCGWNSVLESLCAGVPLIAWPLMAEQPLNARMVVEEIEVGLRPETNDGSVRGFVESKEVEKVVRELMEGEMGKKVRKKAMEVAAMAKTAMEEGGSSWHSLNQLVDETCSCLGRERNKDVVMQ